MEVVHEHLWGGENDVGRVLEYRCRGEVPALHRAAHPHTVRPHAAAHLDRRCHHSVLVYFHSSLEQPRHVHAFKFSPRRDRDTPGLHLGQRDEAGESLG